MIKRYIISAVTLMLLNAVCSALSFADTEAYPTDQTIDSQTAETAACAEPLPSTRAPVGLIVDQYLSPVVGAEGMFALLRGYQELDDYLIPSTAGDTSGSMILGRFGKYLFEGLLMNPAMITQHEVFGHGFRAREFGIPARYRINLFSGLTSLTNQYFQLPRSEQIALTAGGMEATSILARQMRSRWLDYQCVDNREAHFYMKNALDQPLYILNAPRTVHENDSNDVSSYIATVNSWYGRQVLTTHRLRTQTLVDFLDPFLFYSVYSSVMYIIEGNQTWQYPMIPVGDNYRYLPMGRLALAPYGPEYQFINYLKGIDHTYVATLRYGKTGGRSSSGLTLEATRIWTSDLLTFDGRADIWYQPQLFVANPTLVKNRPGAALSVIARYRAFQCIDLMGQVGYKTTGYIPGEILKHSPILRAGFSIYF